MSGLWKQKEEVNFKLPPWTSNLAKLSALTYNAMYERITFVPEIDFWCESLRLGSQLHQTTTTNIAMSYTLLL